jgi:hypothetical protein
MVVIAAIVGLVVAVATEGTAAMAVLLFYGPCSNFLISKPDYAGASFETGVAEWALKVRKCLSRTGPPSLSH